MNGVTRLALAECPGSSRGIFVGPASPTNSEKAKYCSTQCRKVLADLYSISVRQPTTIQATPSRTRGRGTTRAGQRLNCMSCARTQTVYCHIPQPQHNPQDETGHSLRGSATEPRELCSARRRVGVRFSLPCRTPQLRHEPTFSNVRPRHSPRGSAAEPRELCPARRRVGVRSCTIYIEYTVLYYR